MVDTSPLTRTPRAAQKRFPMPLWKVWLGAPDKGESFFGKGQVLCVSACSGKYQERSVEDQWMTELSNKFIACKYNDDANRVWSRQNVVDNGSFIKKKKKTNIKS